MKKRHEKWK